jgi:DNA-binding transcriptional LysR family regulator
MVNFLTFDLNLLRVLDALLREGSTVKAGNRLGLSQPAVSSALARLRHSLGDALFLRQGQGIVPTDYARALATPLRAQLDQLEALLSGPGGFDPATAELTFRIAGSDFFSDMLMPQLAALLGRSAPGVRVQLVDLVPTSYISSLDRYEADLALLPDGPFPDWVDRAPMFWSSFTVIARRGHPALADLTQGAVLPMDRFCDLGHVLFSPEGNLRAMGDAALAKVGRQRRVVMTLPLFSGVCRAVSSSDSIALVPRQIAVMLAEELGLSLYSAPMPIDAPLIVGAWHRRASSTPAHRWMRQEIAAILRPLNEGEPGLLD